MGEGKEGDEGLTHAEAESSVLRGPVSDLSGWCRINSITSHPLLLKILILEVPERKRERESEERGRTRNGHLVTRIVVNSRCETLKESLAVKDAGRLAGDSLLERVRETRLLSPRE